MYLLLLVATTKSEIMDYTNHDFLLYKDTKDVLIYESYADLFHITNISLYRDIINLETEFLKSHDSNNLGNIPRFKNYPNTYLPNYTQYIEKRH